MLLIPSNLEGVETKIISTCTPLALPVPERC